MDTFSSNLLYTCIILAKSGIARKTKGMSKQILALILFGVSAAYLSGPAIFPAAAIRPLNMPFIMAQRPAVAQLLTPPTATVTLRPTVAYVNTTLRGSATFMDPDGNLEGASAYRWLINGTPVVSGIVPQSLLLPLDNSLRSIDGQMPTQSQGLSFVTGRFGQAVEFSKTANSRLAYPAAGNVNPNEGSIEMWVRLTHDLDAPAYDDYPLLFSYFIDDEHHLYMEVNKDRISITSRNEGSYYGTWPGPPGWQAGEWHHLAATWSASANQLALYYDCVLVATDYNHFPALAGTASTFNLGSGNNWGVMDMVLDDVRVSRRALTASEIGAMCNRGYPAPNDEVTLPPGRTAIGDVVTFELTPCDDTGTCGAASSASVTIVATPLGNLQPTPGLLPSGSISFTMSLTTTAPANCRWSEIADTRYVSMTHNFQSGQDTTSHNTVVSGLRDLDDRWFYVRCQDTSTGRDPDDYERQTHLRVLGPWIGNYPRIANLWGNYSSTLGVNFFAGYDLMVVSGWSFANQASAIRAVNPNAKILLPLNATYGGPQDDPLTAEWWNSQPGDLGYNCLLRNSHGAILLVDYWGHPMYNMTVPYCRTVLAQQSVDAYLSAQPKKGNNLAYDGIYWDRLHDAISWLLGDDIDSDLDGQPDDPAALDAAYQAGMEDFFAQVRAHLPNAILMGNDAPQIYAPWLNGRNYEWQLAAILDGVKWLSWGEVVWDYRDWSGRGYPPHTTFIESAPEPFYSEKYTFRHLDQMPPAMEAEVAASYERMRYGLTSALMGDGLFSYDYGPDWHGNLWWYDEFGATHGYPSAALPPRGYLGQPTGDPFLLVDTLDTPDQVINGDFEDGLHGWSWWVNTGSGAAATFDVDATGGISDTAAAHIVVTSASDPWNVEFRQFDKSTVAEQSYTLSFWARSDVTRTVRASIIKQTEPWTDYGFGVQAVVTPQWQHFPLSDNASVTADDGKLEFSVGDVVGELWLDNVQFQEGALGVWARPFSGGLAVINTTREVRTVPLPHVYRKLDGSQAPLFQIRMDDDEARVSGSWSRQPANFSQFGNTVHVITGPNSLATVTYSPTLAYSGTYHVLAWVVPSTTQSSAVSVTIHHSQGATVVLLDETQGQIGWRDLGVYTFDVTGDNGAVLAATGNGTVVADAFKWVSTARYNDGSRVAQITLQPRDGIILVNAFRLFLPIVIKR